MNNGGKTMSEDEIAAATKIVLVVQCDEVTRKVCPGALCEHAFSARIDGFKRYGGKKDIRYAATSCGGCPGRAALRKLVNFKRNIKKKENLAADDVTVHLSSCMTRTNHHGPRCPHIDYIKYQVEEAGFRWLEDSKLSATAEKRRREGMYQ